MRNPFASVIARHSSPGTARDHHAQATSVVESDGDGGVSGQDEMQKYVMFFVRVKVSRAFLLTYPLLIKFQRGREACVAARLHSKAEAAALQAAELEAAGKEAIYVGTVLAVPASPEKVYVSGRSGKDVRKLCEGLADVYSREPIVVPDEDRVVLAQLRLRPKVFRRGAWIKISEGRYKGDLGMINAPSRHVDGAEIIVIPRIGDRTLLTEMEDGTRLKAKRGKGRPSATRMTKSLLELRFGKENVCVVQGGFMCHDWRISNSGHHIISLSYSAFHEAQQPTPYDAARFLSDGSTCVDQLKWKNGEIDMVLQ